MFRFLLRLVLLVMVLGVVAVAVLGYRWAFGDVASDPVEASAPRIDTERARQAGAEIAERVAVGATKAEEVLSEARLTAKIRSKIALDDTLDGSRIDVDTAGTVVTIKGRVASSAQRTRAMQLARETDGVTSVVDRLEVNR